MLKWIAGLFLALFTTTASAHDEPVVGTLVGAGIGAAVAGPPGAAVGAVLGAIIGATEAHETDHGPNGHSPRHHGRVRHTERVAYHGNGNGHGHVHAAGTVVARLKAVRTLGHPYSDEDIEGAPAALAGKTELDGVVAYLQSLGKVAPPEPAPDAHEGH